MATATPTTVTIDEYLHTSYRPDCDYVDGEVEERNLGEKDHAEVASAFIYWFRGRAKEWNIRAYSELRIQVKPTRFRIADVSIVSRDAPDEQILRHPPLAVIEVLSPEDRFSRYEARLKDLSPDGHQAHLGGGPAEPPRL